MKCPKCNGRMVPFSGSSSPSGLTRNKGIQAKPIEGHSCMNCGKWIEDEYIPVCPMPRIETSRDGTSHALSSKYDAFVMQYAQMITEMRKNRRGWLEITTAIKLLLPNKYRPETVRKAYERIMAHDR